jgi:hypothetical protein
MTVTVWGPVHRELTDVLSGHPDDVPAVVDQLARMQGVLDRMPPLLAGNPLADFNRLYLGVTEVVLERLFTGGFADPGFLSRLDVEFAARYFDALRQWGDGSPRCPRVWQVLFGLLGGPQRRALPSAAAGVNAHLNFDLPFALVTTFDHLGGEPADDEDQHRDYLQITEIFAEALPALRPGRRGDPGPRGDPSCLADPGHLADPGPPDDWQVLIDTMSGDEWRGETAAYSRNVAWRNSQRLWGVRHDLAGLARERDRLDTNAAALGRLLVSPLGSFPHKEEPRREVVI